MYYYAGSLFRSDGEGRITKYVLTSENVYTAEPGWYETVTYDPGDGSYTLSDSNQTHWRFTTVPNTPGNLFDGLPVFRLVAIADRNNNPTTFSYNADGLLVSVQDTYLRRISLDYNSAKKLTTIVDPLERRTRLSYDRTGQCLTVITFADGSTVRYSYNAAFQRIGKVDQIGRRFTYLYSKLRPVSILDGSRKGLFRLSNANNWAYDPMQLSKHQRSVLIPGITRSTDGRGNTQINHYDLNGFPTMVIAPDGATTTYSYDLSKMRLASKMDARANTTSYGYDERGNRSAFTNALGQVTRYTYEPLFNQITSMLDANERLTTYEYDGQGNRIRETQAVGLPEERTRAWTYDEHGNVLTETDWSDTLTEYTYDAHGNRDSMTEAVGTPEQRTTLWTYDILGNMTSQTDPLGRVTQFEYDSLNRVTTTCEAVGTPLERCTAYAYDGRGNRVRTTDCNGNSTTNVFDLRNRLVMVIDALGQEESYTYDDNDNRITVTDRNGHTTGYTYDVQNRLETVTDAVGNVTRYEYDPVGNLTRQIDARGNATEYTYDALNRRTSVIAADGGVTAFEYATSATPCCTPTLGSALVSKQIDAEGKITCFKYDNLDRLVRQIRKQNDNDCDVEDDDDAVTVYTYDPNDNRLTVQEPNLNVTTYTYDPLNRLIAELNAAGDATYHAYDLADNRIRTISPNLNVTDNTYDDLNRHIAVVDLEGPVRSTGYDCVGNRTTDTDGNEHTVSYAYDALYRVIAVTDPMGEVTRTDYDPVGNVLRVTDREGHITEYAYDDINRRIQMCEAVGTEVERCTNYDYDAVGNLLRLTDCNGNSTEYVYDELNRRTVEIYPDLPGPDAPPDSNKRFFTYDHVGNILTRTDQKGQVTTYDYTDLYFLRTRSYPVSPPDNFTYDLSGRMMTAERDGWLVTFEYDGANRVTLTRQNGQRVQYAYDVPARTRTLGYPGGRAITETSDARGRLVTVDDGEDSGPIAHYSYDPGDRVLTRGYRNGTVATYTYNANDWITSLEHTLGSTRIAGFGHAYDREGNKRCEEHRHQPARSEAYEYDALYRLVCYSVGELDVNCTVAVPITQTCYALDCVGNWNGKQTDSDPLEIRSHNEANEILAIGPQQILHDHNGNLTEDQQFSYDYDEENRLTSVRRHADLRVVGQYFYDALGRRIAKITDPDPATSSPVGTQYFYNGARQIEGQSQSAITLATYTYGNYIDEVFTMDRASSRLYYHHNSLWSVVALTDTTAAPVERYTYEAYGRPTITAGDYTPVTQNAWNTPRSIANNPYTFTGRQFDNETGVYFYRARSYDSAKGRFLQRDPVTNVAHMYEYSLGNPTYGLDPYGTETLEISYKLTGFLLRQATWTQWDASISSGQDTGSAVVVIDLSVTKSKVTGSSSFDASNNTGNVVVVNAGGRNKEWEWVDLASISHSATAETTKYCCDKKKDWWGIQVIARFRSKATDVVKQVPLADVPAPPKVTVGADGKQPSATVEMSGQDSIRSDVGGSSFSVKPYAKYVVCPDGKGDYTVKLVTTGGGGEAIGDKENTIKSFMPNKYVNPSGWELFYSELSHKKKK